MLIKFGTKLNTKFVKTVFMQLYLNTNCIKVIKTGVSVLLNFSKVDYTWFLEVT